MTTATRKRPSDPRDVLAEANARLKAKGLPPLTTASALERATPDARPQPQEPTRWER
jgi:hypothetical protein